MNLCNGWRHVGTHSQYLPKYGAVEVPNTQYPNMGSWLPISAKKNVSFVILCSRLLHRYCSGAGAGCGGVGGAGEWRRRSHQKHQPAHCQVRTETMDGWKIRLILKSGTGRGPGTGRNHMSFTSSLSCVSSQSIYVDTGQFNR